MVSIFSKHIPTQPFRQTLFVRGEDLDERSSSAYSRDMPPNDGLFQKGKQIINLGASSF